MNKLFLSDRETRNNLFPFTFTRPAADIRVGILTIREKWALGIGCEVISLHADEPLPQDATILPANILPSGTLINAVRDNGVILDHPVWSTVHTIQHPWHIFLLNDWAIREDFLLVTAGRNSEPIPVGITVSHPENIFIESGAKISPCYINASTGPVYIGRNAQVMEGTMIRGPLALCEGAVIKMGTAIYGATTIGPHCVVGGEIKNSVMFANSNKAHGGYLGDSVIGEWCNLGAGTSNSNVKNNAGEISMWNYATKRMEPAGLSKCGLIMGDYSRSAINTSFNTGTTVGICCNIFGDGLAPKFIDNFSWGYSNPSTYEYDKAMTDIERWKNMKGGSLSEQERTGLKLIFDEK